MRRSASNALLLFGGEVAARGFGFLTTAVLARRLGLDGFGQVSFATAILAYGVAATDFGLLAQATRQTARDRSSLGSTTAAIVPLRLLLALAAAGLMVGVALILPKPASVKLLLGLYGLAVIAQGLVLEWVYVGVERMEFVALSRTLTTAAYFGLVLLLVRSADAVLWVPVSFALATLVGAALLGIVYLARFGWPRAEARSWRGLISQAWPIGLASTLTQVHVNAGLVVLGLLGSFAQTGTYGSAFRLLFLLITVDRVFYTVFFPVVSRHLATQPEQLPALLGTVLRLMLAFGLPVCVGTFLLARPLVLLAFGPLYGAAAGELRIMVWFLLVSMFNSTAGYTLVAAGREREFLRNTAIGAAASLALTVPGAWLFGGTGAALGLLLGETAILVAMLPDFLRLARPRLELRILGPILAALVLAPAVLLTRRFGLFSAVGAGAAAYALVLVLARGVDLRDFGLVQR